MKYITHSHRNAENLFNTDNRYPDLYNEIILSIKSISDNDLISTYNSNIRNNKKSLSESINDLLRKKLTNYGWNAESSIFSDPSYKNARDNRRWRLDFSKDEIAVEVAFNHGEAIAWNLIKPVLSSELNHVQKDVQTSAGVIICATEKLKKAGNFDGAVGTYEKYLRYLVPMQQMLPTPLLIIGLQAPDSFVIDKKTKKIVMLEKE